MGRFAHGVGRDIVADTLALAEAAVVIAGLVELEVVCAALGGAVARVVAAAAEKIVRIERCRTWNVALERGH